MCNRVTNHGDMSTFSRPADQFGYADDFTLIAVVPSPGLRVAVAESLSPILEETLTSDEYVSLHLISILNIYIHEILIFTSQSV